MASTWREPSKTVRAWCRHTTQFGPFVTMREPDLRGGGVGATAEKLYFFGLDVVARTVKMRWNEYPEAQKSSMRGFLLSMLTECIRFRFSQEHAGREKFAAALVEIVKRDWPQSWPEFEGTVLQVLERGPVEASVVCKVRWRRAARPPPARGAGPHRPALSSPRTAGAPRRAGGRRGLGL